MIIYAIFVKKKKKKKRKKRKKKKKKRQKRKQRELVCERGYVKNDPPHPYRGDTGHFVHLYVLKGQKVVERQSHPHLER
jgi:hypothetical protein